MTARVGNKGGDDGGDGEMDRRTGGNDHNGAGGRKEVAQRNKA